MPPVRSAGSGSRYLVVDSSFFCRKMHGLRVPGGVWVRVAGIDLIQDEIGQQHKMHVARQTWNVAAVWMPIFEAFAVEGADEPSEHALYGVLVLDSEHPFSVRGRIASARARAHAALCISAESVVETTHAVACGPEAARDPRPWPERWCEYLCASPHVPELPHYATIAHEVSPGLRAQTFLDALEALGGVLKRDFRYEAGVTDVDSSPAVFFEKGGGVCQDFSHATIGVLRRAGVPARYASGYVYDPAVDSTHATLRGAAASHAWVQAWHEELGWVGLDPTNDKLVDWQYVRVAVGRDYGDVQPVRGIFRGEGEQMLSVSVEVTHLRTEE